MKRTLVSILVLVAMLLSLCTGAFAEELETVTVVVPRSLECLDDMSMWVADAMGYFEEEGLKFNMEQAYGTSDVQMVATGQADLCCPSPNLTLPSIEAGLPVISVAHYDAINIFGMAVRPDSGIETWEDLKGKTIALGDAAWQSIAAPTVVAAGLSVDDMEWIVCGDARFQMVGEGQVDVLFTWVSEYEQLLGQGFDFIYLDGNEVLPVFANSFVASTSAVKDNPEKLKAFLRAQQKGMYFLLLSPEKGADITLNRFPAIQVDWAAALGAANGRNRQAFGLSEESAAATIAAGIGRGTDEAWAQFIEGAVSVGVLQAALDPSICYTNELLPDPLTEEEKAAIQADVDAYVCSSEVYLAAH